MTFQQQSNGLFWQSLLLAGLLAACSSEKGQGSEPIEPVDTPAKLQVQIADVEITTRSGAGSATDLSDKEIVLYAVNKKSGETDYGTAPTGTSATYKVSGTTAVPATMGGDLWLTDEVATIYAGYPSGVVTEGDPSPTLPVPENTIVLEPSVAAGDNLEIDFTTVDKDYMYGVSYANSQFKQSQPEASNGKVATESPSSISFGFKHAFAQIKLIVSRSDYNGTGTITKLEYNRQMPLLKSGSKMNLKDGKITDTEADASRSYIYDMSRTIATRETLSVINYALPCDASASTISLTVDGKEMSVKFNGDAEWTAGMIYAYTVMINNTGLELKGFNLVGWDDVAINGGTFQ